MAKRTSSSKLTKKVSTRKRRAKRSVKRRNPSGESVGSRASGIVSDAWSEVLSLALPGLAGYAGGCAAGWITYRVAKKKSKKLARHAGPLGSVAFAIAASYATKRYDKLRPYETPVVIGAWLAALKGTLQTYVPQWSWILGDYQLLDALPASATPGNGASPSKDDLDEVAKMLEGYDKAYDEIDGNTTGSSLPSSGEDDFNDIPGLNDSGLNVGIFSGGLAN